MSKSTYSHEQIIQAGQFTPEDMNEIFQRRRNHNRLGFAYQMAFVRLVNQFPAQQPLEVLPELLAYVGLQLGIKTEVIKLYAQRQPTITEHRQAITLYEGMRRFEEIERRMLADFLFNEASRLEQTGPLLTQAKRFLSEHSILYPGDEVLRRLVAEQRQAARDHIYERITNSLDQEMRENLDDLLETKNAYFTPLHTLKQPPGRASPAAILRLTTKLELIRETGALHIDLSWLNNNYQRSLARYVRHRSAGRLKRLKSARRYAVLVCFLHQLYADTIDFLIEMHDKLMTGVYTRAENNIAKEMNRRRRAINRSLATFHTLGTIVLDDSIDDGQLRRILFQQIDKESLTKQVSEVDK